MFSEDTGSVLPSREEEEEAALGRAKLEKESAVFVRAWAVGRDNFFSLSAISLLTRGGNVFYCVPSTVLLVPGTWK